LTCAETALLDHVGWRREEEREKKKEKKKGGGDQVSRASLGNQKGERRMRSCGHGWETFGYRILRLGEKSEKEKNNRRRDSRVESINRGTAAP